MKVRWRYVLPILQVIGSAFLLVLVQLDARNNQELACWDCMSTPMMLLLVLDMPAIVVAAPLIRFGPNPLVFKFFIVLLLVGTLWWWIGRKADRIPNLPPRTKWMLLGYLPGVVGCLLAIFAEVRDWQNSPRARLLDVSVLVWAAAFLYFFVRKSMVLVRPRANT